MLETIAGPSGLKAETVMQCPVVCCDPEVPEVQALMQHMQTTLETPIAIKRSNGATDARHFIALNVPISIIGRELARRIYLPLGVVDLSLAPTPKVGDSVGEILNILGVDPIGAPGSTACVALLNDAVKKGGSFASRSVGGRIPAPIHSLTN